MARVAGDRPPRLPAHLRPRRKNNRWSWGAPSLGLPQCTGRLPSEPFRQISVKRRDNRQPLPTASLVLTNRNCRRTVRLTIRPVHSDFTDPPVVVMFLKKPPI